MVGKVTQTTYADEMYGNRSEWIEPVPDLTCVGDLVAYYWEIEFDYEFDYDGELTVNIQCNNGAGTEVVILSAIEDVPCKPVGNVGLINGGGVRFDGQSYLECQVPSIRNIVSELLGGADVGQTDVYDNFEVNAQLLIQARDSEILLPIVSHPSFDFLLEYTKENDSGIWTIFHKNIDEIDTAYFSADPDFMKFFNHVDKAAGVLDGTIFQHFHNDSGMNPHDAPEITYLLESDFGGSVPLVIGKYNNDEGDHFYQGIIRSIFIDPGNYVRPPGGL